MPRGGTNLELLAVHGGDFRLLADCEGVGDSLPGGLGGHHKVVATLLDLRDGFDVLGHLDHVGRELCEKRRAEVLPSGPSETRPTGATIAEACHPPPAAPSLTHSLEELLVVLLGVDLPCSAEVHVAGLLRILLRPGKLLTTV